MGPKHTKKKLERQIYWTPTTSTYHNIFYSTNMKNTHCIKKIMHKQGEQCTVLGEQGVAGPLEGCVKTHLWLDRLIHHVQRWSWHHPTGIRRQRHWRSLECMRWDGELLVKSHLVARWRPWSRPLRFCHMKPRKQSTSRLLLLLTPTSFLFLGPCHRHYPFWTYFLSVLFYVQHATCNLLSFDKASVGPIRWPHFCMSRSLEN